MAEKFVNRVRRWAQNSRHLFPWLRKWIQERPLYGDGRIYLLSVGLGLGVGALSILLALALHAVRETLLFQTVGFHPPMPGLEGTGGFSALVARPWLLPLIPALGGLLMGWIAEKASPECYGGGSDEIIHAFHHNRGQVRSRVMGVKILTSALTVGSGGAGGKEGPASQIGASAGSSLANWFHLDDGERRTLMTAGMAAGMGAVFKAPLGAALFACEVYYTQSEFETRALIPSLIASILSFTTYALVFGFAPLYTLPAYPTFNFSDILPLTLLALAAGGVSVLFVHILRWSHNEFQRYEIPRMVRPALGGLAVGTLAWVAYLVLKDVRVLGILSEGYGSVQEALDGHAGLVLLLVLLVGKMLASAITLGSGGSAGVFAPAMVMGGTLGASVGMAAQDFMPSLGLSPSAYMILGMGGFFAGSSRAPVSTIIMMTEVAQSYTVLLPLMWVCAVAFLISRTETLFTGQMARMADSPAHRGEFVVDVLKGLKVSDIVRSKGETAVLSPGTPLRKILKTAREVRQGLYPVVDPKNKVLGVLSLRSPQDFLFEDSLSDLVVAQELMKGDYKSLSPKQDLESVLAVLTQNQEEELMVIDDDGKFTGLVSRGDLIQAYGREMIALKGGPA